MISGSDRRALGLAVLLAGLTLAACGGSGDTASDDSPADGSAPHVSVPTSDWRPGDPGRRALLQGTLDLSDPACPRVVTDDGETGTVVVWPAGTYAAERFGTYGLYAEDDTQLASHGDRLVLGGGGSDAGVGSGCEAADGSVFVVEAEIRTAER